MNESSNQNSEIKDTLEECYSELCGLYQRYEKMNNGDARRYSRALQKCVSLLNQFSGGTFEQPQNLVEQSEAKEWGNDTQRFNGRDRRKLGDRRKSASQLRGRT